MLVPTLAVALFLAPQGNQEYRRGSDLVKECRAFIKIMDTTTTPEPLELSDGNYCMGYLDGVVAYMDPASSHVCLPLHTTSTLARVYLLYMDKHPKLFDQDQKLGAYLSLLDAYPCPAKQ